MPAHLKHGMRNTPEYVSWSAMRGRCNCETDPAYVKYGGRGIKVCEAWGDFLQFYSDMGPRPSLAHSIERLDNDGDYTPGNCVWATAMEQCYNRSTSRLVVTDAGVFTLKDYTDKTGVKYDTVLKRLKRGWSMDRALHEKVA